MYTYLYFISVISCLDCNVCEQDCNDNLVTCLESCQSDPICMSDCSRQLVQCQDDCAARCGEHIKLLVLNPNKNEQLKIDLKPGGEETVTSLSFDQSYDERHWMCSFSLHNQMYLIGGNDGLINERRQLLVTESGIEVLEQLPFRFNDGRCLNYDDQHVLACAGDYGYQKECFKFDGYNYTRMSLTVFDHYRGGMARWRSQALIMGGYYNGAGTVELFDGESGWQPVSENKMLEKFYGFTAIGINDTVFTFGGALRRESLIVNYVYKMNPENFKFTQNEQNLVTYRYGHRTVITGNTVLHVGGDGRKSIESWTLNDEGSFDIAETEFATNVWLGYAETFVLE